MTSVPSQNTRLDFRLKPEHKSLIERAASAEGQTVTNFALGTLIKAAHETIQRASLTTLSARDADIFLGMLSADAEPNAALKSAAKRYKAKRG